MMDKYINVVDTTPIFFTTDSRIINDLLSLIRESVVKKLNTFWLW